MIDTHECFEGVKFLTESCPFHFEKYNLNYTEERNTISEWAVTQTIGRVYLDRKNKLTIAFENNDDATLFVLMFSNHIQ